MDRGVVTPNWKSRVSAAQPAAAVETRSIGTSGRSAADSPFVIDKSGQWWKGEDFNDLSEFITAYSAQNYPTQRVVQSRCESCGSTRLRLRFDDDEGGAESTCVECGAVRLLLDSEEYWEDADPADASCPCGGEEFEVGVGFSLRDDGDVRWVYIGGRCTSCGVLGVFADWKIDYAPTDHLLTNV